jgi:hypothetical protein
MLRGTSTGRELKYQRLAVEVREDVARRLEQSAGRYARYTSAADVAAECVHLYLDLLEWLDGETDKVKKALTRRELKKRTKALS